MTFIKFLYFCFLLIITIIINFSKDYVKVNPYNFMEDKEILISVTGGSDNNLNQADLTVFTNHPGFPINYDRWTDRASVTIADLQNDGTNELLLPTYDGYIYAWNAAGQVISGFPINTGWHISGRLALGDLNHDGDLEIVAGLESQSTGIGARISIWHPNGQFYSGWPKDTACAMSNQQCSAAAIILEDLDKDSNLEVIVATNNRDLTTNDPSRYVPNLYVWKSNGTIAPGSWPNEDTNNVAIIGQMAVGDLDGDSYPDIVTGRDYNRLFAFNRLGANLEGWPHYVWYPYDVNDWNDDQIEFPRSSPALADLDQDGDLEYIIPGHRRHVNQTSYLNTDLLVYNANATRFLGWELPASGASLMGSNSTRMIEAPAIVDLNGDGQSEIIIAGQDGYIRAYTAEKQLLWSYDYAQGKDVHASETVIGDVDGDGWNEVVFGTFWVNLVSKGQVGVYILDHTGILKAGAPLLLNSVGVSSSPSLGDLDSDGLIEIATATYDGWLYVWDASGTASPSSLPWPMARHDLQRTGLYQDLLPNFSLSRKFVSTPNAMDGEIVTFSINLVNSGATVNETFSLTDIIPPGLSYVPGSLDASSGTIDESLSPLLTWSGSITPLESVLIWYRVRVDTEVPGSITNTATLSAESTEMNISSTLIVNGKNLFFPLIQH